SLLAQRIPANRVKLVVSRHDTRDTYSVAQLEDSLKHQAAVLIPAADEVATTALNRGIPYVLGKPTSPPARAIGHLADQIVRDMEAAAQAASGNTR
ncbi:MAG: hypothetical protein ABFE07_23330, partial [Armatimonadia bacterium]